MTSDLQSQLQTSLGEDFRIERELGGGGMSRVFLAEEIRLGRRVVVKVLSSPAGVGLSADRFDREIRLAATLQDPRIVPLLQTGRSGDMPFYTMPYIDGESLRARLARGPVPLDEAVGILRDVALALEYAHARQVVHRDIKPENILLTRRTAVVTDFGIAKAVSAAAETASDGALTGIGTVIGTPAYMAPEQAVGDVVDNRTDLYAWGVVAYEMLTGVHPYASHTTPQSLLAAHIAELPPPLAQRRPDLPRALTALVDRCLAKDPDLRPKDAAAVLAQLSEPADPGLRPKTGLGARQLLVSGFALALILSVGAWRLHLASERRWARESAVTESAALRDAHRPMEAYQVLERAAGYLPSDSGIARALAARTQVVTVLSTPSPATVEIQDYTTPDSAWHRLGTTPLHNVKAPRGYFRWRLTIPGGQAGVLLAAPIPNDTMRFTIDTMSAGAGVAHVPEGRWADMIAFVGWVGPYHLPAFDIDRYEVTNRQYQEFVDQDGYGKKEYWKEKFLDHGHELSWDEAMRRFRDKTGRPGPSSWEGGHYPEGQADYPVSGVSWFEASAYAASVGKTLPTFAQWYEASPADLASYLAPLSNMEHSGPAPVGSFKGLGPYGTYDMAGNVREWSLNALDPDRRFILGGAWMSANYIATDPEALSPFDRSAGNGIRCVRNLGPLPAEITRPIKPLDRDFAKYTPASDATLRGYQAMYAYRKGDLDARVEGVVRDAADWREEKITFNPAYGGERMAAYLFLPKKVRPPYQTVVFFPSARVDGIENSKDLGDTEFFDYVVKSGRAVLYPIYKDTYERRTDNSLPGAEQQIDLTIQRYRDVARSLDYLGTRADIDTTRLAYLGVSMGAAEGVIYATLAQDRLKAVVFLDGGYFLGKAPAGGDQADFAPRLKKPLLMVNGRYDFTFSYERAQLPLFRMVGTPEADKRHAVLPTPHDVRADRAELVKEVLGWLDKYLGRVH